MDNIIYIKQHKDTFYNFSETPLVSEKKFDMKLMIIL